MLAAVEEDGAEAVHEPADHVDGGRQLDHRHRPVARHDQRQPGRPALADVVLVDLSFLQQLHPRVELCLRLRRQLRIGRAEAPGVGPRAGVDEPVAGQIERRLRPRPSRGSPAPARSGARWRRLRRLTAPCASIGAERDRRSATSDACDRADRSKHRPIAPYFSRRRPAAPDARSSVRPSASVTDVKMADPGSPDLSGRPTTVTLSPGFSVFDFQPARTR